MADAVSLSARRHGSGLQRRLLLLLLVPLFLLAILNTWFDFRVRRQCGPAARPPVADNLVPLLADSVMAGGTTPADPPLLLMAPPVEDFLMQRPGLSAFAVARPGGQVLVGDPWLSGMPPHTDEPEFSSEEFEGMTYRIVSQRVNTVAGELVVRLADGSDPRQQWLRLLWLKVVLPNLVLVIGGLFCRELGRAPGPASAAGVEGRGGAPLAPRPLGAGRRELRPTRCARWCCR